MYFALCRYLSVCLLILIFICVRVRIHVYVDWRGCVCMYIDTHTKVHVYILLDMNIRKNDVKYACTYIVDFP